MRGPVGRHYHVLWSWVPAFAGTTANLAPIRVTVQINRGVAK